MLREAPSLVEKVKVTKKAEGLLAEMLSPDQLKDWESNRAFDVRGSDGDIYRIVYSGPYSATGVVNRFGMRSNVWPNGLTVPADQAIGMLLYVMNDAEKAYRTGCHDAVSGGYVPTGKYL